MNKNTRAQLTKIQNDLNSVKFVLETIQADEQDKFDNMPEGLQGSESGEAVQKAASDLEEAVEELGTAIDAVDNAIAKCDDAKSA